MRREYVEALLAKVSGMSDSGSIETRITVPHLRELCRAWLALDGAETAYVEPRNGLAVLHERPMPLAMIGQRVRIVPVEGGKGVAGG